MLNVLHLNLRAIGAVNTLSHGIWAESKGNGAGLVANSKTGTALVAGSDTSHGIWAESRGGGTGLIANSKTGTGLSAGSDTSHGIWAESRGNGAGLVANSKTGAGLAAGSDTGDGIYAESRGGGRGIYATSKTGLAGYFKGDVEVTGDIRLVNADCAEEFDIMTPVEPGTVMTLDNNGSLEPSRNPYDKKVAGIISGGGGYKPGIVLDKQARFAATTKK